MTTQTEAPIGGNAISTALDALTAAMRAHTEHHAAVRAVIALLDKMEFADAMACTDEYDLVLPVETVLASLRDDTQAASDTCEAVIKQLLEANHG